MAAVVTAGAVAWAVLILLAPALRGAHAPVTLRTAAVLTYMAGGHICHQRPERSFSLATRPLPVCGRCTGLYLSGALGLLGAIRGRLRVPRAYASWPAAWRRVPGRSAGTVRLDARAGWLVLAGVPTLLTWGLEVAGWWDAGTALRALAAVPLGAMAGWLIGTRLQVDATHGPGPDPGGS